MANMELITSVTVGSGGASSVTLPATGTIPSTYTDLKLMMSTRGSSSGVADLYISFNGSTSNLSLKYLAAAGSGTPGASSQSNGQIGIVNGTSATTSTFNSTEVYIPNYASGNYKSFSVDDVSENNATTAYASMWANLWSNNAAITTITLTLAAGSFVEGSTFYLYGISNVTSGSKATGGIVSSDGTYWYHMFPFSGTFTPTTAISADVLCVAGGGGASWGAGGAGGFRVLTSQSLTAQNYTCTIGAGGTGGVFSLSAPTSGGNSSFAGSGFTTISSTGGGYGAYNAGTHQPASTGGSGGGGSYASTNGAITGAAGNAGSYSPVEGYAGGNGNGGGPGYPGGGGGGATTVGSAATGGVGGAGGTGNNSYSSWANATQTGVNGYYAGGGGGGAQAPGVGGTGGAGGGGTGVATTTGGAGIANTGGGGGGTDSAGGSTVKGGSGGSGLVIIRYAI